MGSVGRQSFRYPKKLIELLGEAMTYMEVRFLVDDLNLEIKSNKPQEEASADTPTPEAETPEAPAGALGGGIRLREQDSASRCCS